VLFRKIEDFLLDPGCELLELVQLVLALEVDGLSFCKRVLEHLFKLSLLCQFLIFLSNLVLHGFDLFVPCFHVFHVLFPEFAESLVLLVLRLRLEHVHNFGLKLVELCMTVLQLRYAL
jgi:hypothetical protein